MYCAQALLWLGRELRPQALWGYYHYPYCHNYQHGNPNCNTQVWSNKGVLRYWKILRQFEYEWLSDMHNHFTLIMLTMITICIFPPGNGKQWCLCVVDKGKHRPVSKHLHNREQRLECQGPSTHGPGEAGGGHPHEASCPVHLHSHTALLLVQVRATNPWMTRDLLCGNGTV